VSVSGKAITTIASTMNTMLTRRTRSTSRRRDTRRFANSVTTKDHSKTTMPKTVMIQPASPSQSDMNEPVSVSTSPTMLQKAASSPSAKFAKRVEGSSGARGNDGVATGAGY
jgi:hypothetical protein